jgi:hypothetical protein
LISTELNQHFEDSNEPFLIKLTEDETTNRFYEGVTEESLIESFSILVDLLNNKNNTKSKSVASSFDQKLIPSFKLLSQKLDCNALIQSICRFSKTSTFTFEPSNFKIGEPEFEFLIGSKVYKCSKSSAVIFSAKALKLLCDEEINRIELQIPSNVDSEEFANILNEVFDLLIGKPLEINENNYLNILSISIQIDNPELTQKCFEFFKNIENPKVEQLLFIFQTIDLSSISFDISSFISIISNNFENISKNELLKILPFGLSLILKPDSLHLNNEDSLFEFLKEYNSEWGDCQIFLFENIYFEYLSPQNLFQIFQFPPSLISSSFWQSLSYIANPNPNSRQIDILPIVFLPI